jgi:hypothetical protein
LLPPHAPDMLTVRIQAIDGTGTFTLSDSQPCRLLTLLRRHYPASTLQRPCPTPAMAAAFRDVEAATLATDGSPLMTTNHLSNVPCPLPRRIERVRQFMICNLQQLKTQRDGLLVISELTKSRVGSMFLVMVGIRPRSAQRCRVFHWLRHDCGYPQHPPHQR